MIFVKIDASKTWKSLLTDRPTKVHDFFMDCQVLLKISQSIYEDYHLNEKNSFEFGIPTRRIKKLPVLPFGGNIYPHDSSLL